MEDNEEFQDQECSSSSNGNGKAQKLTKDRSHVWKKVAWFARKSRTKDEFPSEASAAEANVSHTPCTQPVVNMELDSASADVAFEMNQSQSAFPNNVWEKYSSERNSITFEENLEGYPMKRSRLHPNGDVLEQNCLKPSVAKAIFYQADAMKTCSNTNTQHSWETDKKTNVLPYEYFHDNTLGRSVSLPANMVSEACHCSACCTCRPSKRLLGLCPAYSRLSASTASLDTGLTLSAESTSGSIEAAAACSFKDNYFQECNELAAGTESVHGTSNPAHVKFESCVEKRVKLQSPTRANHNNISSAFKSNSLPAYFSKKCKICNRPKSHLPKMFMDYSCVSRGNAALTSAQDVCICSTKNTVVHCTRFINQNVNEVAEKFDRERRRNSLYNAQKIGPQEFKNKKLMVGAWFSNFNDEQKNLLLKDLMEQCDLPQMHLLSVKMEMCLHEGCPPNCCDIISWLPHNLATKIVTFLDPVSLCHASMVCKHWYRLATESLLWKHFCSLPKWQASRSEEQKQFIQHMLPNGNINWKAVLSERYRLRSNWLKGRCNVRTFEGHTQGISCVQFDDTRIVSGSSDKSIKVWNIRTNTPWLVQTLVGHSGTVRCLHLEGNRLVSGSTDKNIKVWDLSTQQSWSSIACKVTMVGHADTVRCIQVDDEKVVSGSYDKTLKVWDIKSGRCKLTLSGHGAAVLCVQFDKSKIVSGSCDKTIKVWTFDGQCIRTLQDHHDAVTCLQFDETRIVSGSLDCNLKFWDVRSGVCVKTIDWKASEGHTGVVRCLQADSWRVVSASDDKTIKVWNVETGQRLVTLRNHTDGVTCLQFSDSIIVSGSYDKTVKLWDFTSC